MHSAFHAFLAAFLGRQASQVLVSWFSEGGVLLSNWQSRRIKSSPPKDHFQLVQDPHCTLLVYQMISQSMLQRLGLMIRHVFMLSELGLVDDEAFQCSSGNLRRWWLISSLIGVRPLGTVPSFSLFPLSSVSSFSFDLGKHWRAGQHRLRTGTKLLQ